MCILQRLHHSQHTLPARHLCPATLDRQDSDASELCPQKACRNMQGLPGKPLHTRPASASLFNRNPRCQVILQVSTKDALPKNPASRCFAWHALCAAQQMSLLHCQHTRNPSQLLPAVRRARSCISCCSLLQSAPVIVAVQHPAAAAPAMWLCFAACTPWWPSLDSQRPRFR